MRLYLDEDLSDEIATIGREKFGLDVVSAHALGLEHLPDNEQLAFATQERRCIVTRNGRDFVRLTNIFQANGWSHPGVVSVPNSFSGQEFMLIARGLAQLHALYPEDVYPYAFVYLPYVPDDSSTS